MAAAAVREANDLFQKFKQAYSAKKYDGADGLHALLKKLKIVFTRFPTFLNPAITAAEAPTRAQEVLLVRETFEHACLAAASRVSEDPDTALADFGRHFEVLRQYYCDFPDVDRSERRLLVLGLHLLRLLSLGGQSRSFHMELESIPAEDQDNMYVKDVVQLERYLQEGSYNKLLDARKKVPSSDYAPMMDMLLETVRREVYDCAMTAYDSLSVEGACQLLMFQGDAAKKDMQTFVTKETERRRQAAEDSGVEFDEKKAWRMDGDRFLFVDKQLDKTQRKDRLPFDALLLQQFNYANEMQRVV